MRKTYLNRNGERIFEIESFGFYLIVWNYGNEDYEDIFILEYNEAKNWIHDIMKKYRYEIENYNEDLEL